MKLITMLVAMLLITPVMAGPLQGPHKHGTLEVAIVHDNDYLMFNMVVTSKDLLGFERSPNTRKKKAMVAKQYKKLYEEASLSKLFKFSPAGACKPHSADMFSDMLDYHEHDDAKDAISTGAKDVHSVGDKEGHSDFFLNYVFDCKGQNVDLIQLTFHEVFPSIERVNFYGEGEFSGKVVATAKAENAIVSGSK